MKKTGTIQSFNVSPKGFYEGLLLQTAKKRIQVNFRGGVPPSLMEALEPGTEVALEVEPEEAHGNAQHPVFRLVRVMGERRGEVDGHFSGRIARLNFALHGEVNGGILESGDFLHLKPEGAAAVGLETGMEVEGSGEWKPMVNGRSVIEAAEVNGQAIGPHKATKKHAR